MKAVCVELPVQTPAPKYRRVKASDLGPSFFFSGVGFVVFGFGVRFQAM